MVEMYIASVSNRKVSKIVEKFCRHKVSKHFVSTLTISFEETVKSWQYKALDDEIYSFLMVM